MNTYPNFRYDDKFVLKMSPLLKVIILYSLRHLIFVSLAYNPSQKMGGSLDFLKHQVNPLLVISDIPVLVLLYAWVNRSVGASTRIRSIWYKGRELLMVSVALHFSLMIWLSGKAMLRYPTGSGSTVILLSLVDMAILLYLLRSQLVKDIFADFPNSSHK